MAGTTQSIANQSAYQAGIIRLGAGEYMVRSTSNPAKGHIVIGGQCDCKGFTYRGTCRHVSLARAYESAVESGIESPGAEDLRYYQILEDAAEERSKRGLPLRPP